ncbi:hypothetical protein CRENBAI_025333 [Crenichthys baileyi]|uniref:Septin n=1 Tax=Crenichthys baileyi TaxID=28760 RepID=A0AAV9S9H7_9TELE
MKSLREEEYEQQEVSWKGQPSITIHHRHSAEQEEANWDRPAPRKLDSPGDSLLPSPCEPLNQRYELSESGLGKSTLINSLFLTDLYSKDYPGPSQRIKKTVQVEVQEKRRQRCCRIRKTVGVKEDGGTMRETATRLSCVLIWLRQTGKRGGGRLLLEERIEKIGRETVEQSKVLIKEGGVQLTLTIVDTPGFGDAVDNSNCWQPVINYIDSKFEDFLNAESRIMKEIQEHKIKIYEFPDTEDDEDNKLIRKIKEKMPLAVVGSNVVVEVNGKKIRGRQYPWGVAEVENGEHCDFTVLRNMLIRTHMQDLKDVTNNVHYENYRSKKLAAVTCNGVDTSKTKGQLTKSPLAQMEEERREHVMKMKKMEAEMEQVFEMKVKEKKQKLKDSEAELERRHEQMKRNLEAQYKELEEKRRVFEDEKANWEAQQRILEQQKLDASKTMEKNKKKGKIF